MRSKVLDNNILKIAVLEKLGVSERTLSRKILSAMTITAITRRQALWLVARESGLVMGRYLNSNELAELREITGATNNSKPLIVQTLKQEVPRTPKKKRNFVARIVEAVENNLFYRILAIIAVVAGFIGLVVLLF